jgi:hypothetical protein
LTTSPFDFLDILATEVSSRFKSSGCKTRTLEIIFAMLAAHFQKASTSKVKKLGSLFGSKKWTRKVTPVLRMRENTT